MYSIAKGFVICFYNFPHSPTNLSTTRTPINPALLYSFAPEALYTHFKLDSLVLCLHITYRSASNIHPHHLPHVIKSATRFFTSIHRTKSSSPNLCYTHLLPEAVYEILYTFLRHIASVKRKLPFILSFIHSASYSSCHTCYNNYLVSFPHGRHHYIYILFHFNLRQRKHITYTLFFFICTYDNDPHHSRTTTSAVAVSISTSQHLHPLSAPIRGRGTGRGSTRERRAHSPITKDYQIHLTVQQCILFPIQQHEREDAHP